MSMREIYQCDFCSALIDEGITLSCDPPIGKGFVTVVCGHPELISASSSVTKHICLECVSEIMRVSEEGVRKRMGEMK